MINDIAMEIAIVVGTIVIIGYIFYVLFIKGIIWPLLGFIFGTYGGELIIKHIFPSSGAIIMIFISYNISWAEFIAAIITLMSICYFMKD